jgi:2,5-dihydroxypyridine 5,6-dioxygenase
MKRIEMIKGAQKMVDDCTQVKRGEIVLIVTDTVTPTSIAEVLAIACRERGAEPIIMIINPLPVEQNDPSQLVGEAMQKAHVIFWVCSRSNYHSPSRLKALKAGARYFIFTELTEDLMFKGAIEANFQETKGLIEKTANALGKAKEARVTTPAGTDLYLDFRGRPEKVLNRNAICDGPGDSKGIILEAAISPAVGTAQGVVVCDAHVTLFKPGLVKEPIRCVIKDGAIVKLEGGGEAARLAGLLKAFNDPLVYNVAELGIGLNPKSQMIGVKTQDKSVYGTCHIGFGSNITWGGDIKAATHYDLVLYAPKIALDGVTILEDYAFTV